MKNKKSPYYGYLLMLTIGWFLFAAEDIDEEIIKNVQFFSQMDVIENLDLASNLETLMKEEGSR